MKTNKFNPVLETIPNKSSYSPSALFGHSIRMMLDNSANAEVQFQEPKDGGVLDVVISCSEGSRCQVVCHIQKDSLNIDFSAADEKAPASKAQFPAPVLRPEELKSVRIPTDEEWDAFMDVTGENNDLANWKNIYSWTLGVGELASSRAVRGWVSARLWYRHTATSRFVSVGFRPAFEPLNPDSLVSGQRVVVGTLYMDGKPVAVPKNPVCDGDILNYIPGATLEMREALDDPDFQVQTIKVGDILVCDRNLLKMISWTDIENQGFCPGHPQKLCPEDIKTVRIPTDEEWDAFMDVTDENNDLANWRDMLSWTLNADKPASYRAVRGYYSARYWDPDTATYRSVSVGFRPAFESLSSDRLEDGQCIIVGTLYMDGKPVPVPKSPVCDGDIMDYIPGATLEMREALDDPDFQVQAIKVGNVLVCDRNLLKMISWADIENQGFCPGHPQKLCPEDIKTARIPTDEEWDWFMDVTGENNDLANWKNIYSWTLGVGELASNRAVRGCFSARFWNYFNASLRYVYVGFRPAFEPLNPDSLVSGQRVVVGTLYMDGKPVAVPKNPVCDGDILNYIPGATLEMREALDDPDFQVQTIKVGDILVCDRNLLKMISWTDIENQGFCPGHPQKLCPEDIKTVRIPTDEEWDAFMDVTGENNDLANWKDMFSWTLGVGKLASNRAVRGWMSARRWLNNNATYRNVGVGFRPAFEPLNPDSLVSGQRVVVGTLYMDGKPVAVPKNPVCDGDILNYIPGATLEMREALDDPDFQVQAIKVGDILVCDRNLLKMISWIDIENQGFYPGGVADDCKYCSGKTRMSFRCDVRTLRDDGIVEDIPVPSIRCPYCGRILEKGVS